MAGADEDGSSEGDGVVGGGWATGRDPCDKNVGDAEIGGKGLGAAGGAGVELETGGGGGAEGAGESPPPTTIRRIALDVGGGTLSAPSFFKNCSWNLSA